ncbi:nickel-responsive transcriptional regulator NikR [Oryzibacter oryziterrae]|uniref:nickel-responsive transcriptional regulator NikR n=1 Tax=Oryzibacter oryziterrae TaxID=2766474 RepID=UPI001F002E40|nr:nickel-responsive transcriptional regulator NikR [Oryzibacter oryziterrae]
MQRVTITLDDDLVSEIDAFMLSRGYNSRSEALRDLTRAGLNDLATPADPTRTCVGAVVYSFDHEKRELARRLAAVHHHHHDLSLATTHVHLDDNNCLEVTLLKGSVGEVQHFAEHLTAERGVRYGKLVIVPIDLPTEAAAVRHQIHGPHD